MRMAGIVAAALVAVLSLGACASVGLKQQAVTGLQLAEASSGVAQDAERRLYATGSVKALTPAVHAAISRGFSTVFQDEHDAAVAMKAWRSGDPAPASLGALLRDASDAWTALVPLLGDLGAVNVVALVQGWVAKVAAVAATIGAAIPPGVRDALAFTPPTAAGAR